MISQKGIPKEILPRTIHTEIHSEAISLKICLTALSPEIYTTEFAVENNSKRKSFGNFSTRKITENPQTITLL